LRSLRWTFFDDRQFECSDLNPLEEATGYQSLASEYSHSQEDIAQDRRQSRSHVANTLRLLNLPEKGEGLFNSGKLTAGHARMLVARSMPKIWPTRSSNQGLNVRQVEAMARKTTQRRRRPASTAGQPGKDADIEALEMRLGNALGLTVTIDHRANGGGALQVKVPHARAARRCHRAAGGRTKLR